jgi:sRNA-binding protein
MVPTDPAWDDAVSGSSSDQKGQSPSFADLFGEVRPMEPPPGDGASYTEVMAWLGIVTEPAPQMDLWRDTPGAPSAETPSEWFERDRERRRREQQELAREARRFERRRKKRAERETKEAAEAAHQADPAEITSADARPSAELVAAFTPSSGSVLPTAARPRATERRR